MSISLQNTLFSKKSRSIVLLVVLLACLFLLTKAASRLRNNDFIEYWSAVKIVMSGGNPYNPDELMVFQKQGGSDATQPLMMYNPPWTLAIIGIFGMLDRPISQLIWLLFQIGIVLFCTIQFWHLYEGRPNQQWIAWLLAFLFAPTILVLELGQITPVILLGITGLIYFTETRRNDWLAGISLVLISTKPQLTLILWLAILFWIFQQRRWVIPLVSLVTIFIFTGVILAFNPHILQQYFEFVISGLIPPFATPTIGSYLRYLWFGIDKQFLQFLPFIIGAGWFILHWCKKRKNWQWMDELPFLLLVSAISAPFAWTYDYVILVPVIIQAAVWLVKNRTQWLSWFLVGIFIVINFVTFILHLKLSDFWFIWTAPFLLAWYLLIRWRYANSGERLVSFEYQ